MKFKYDFDSVIDCDSAILQLKKNGIARIPNYLQSSIVDELNNEFFHILSDKSDAVFSQTRHPGNENGRVARMHPWHQSALQDFPQTTKVFQDDFMRKISQAYYGPHEVDFNDELFITHELPHKVPTLPWHFDRVQSLKFWFNLTETTAEDGAFEYCPGTHWEGRYRAGYYLSQGYGIENIPNDIDEGLIKNPVTLELNAGDLLIFDPDGFHRSGHVLAGGEQRVLRAHTHPKYARRYRDKPFSMGWWLRSKLNINKWVSSTASSRILGEKIKENTKNRNLNQAFNMDNKH